MSPVRAGQARSSRIATGRCLASVSTGAEPVGVATAAGAKPVVCVVAGALFDSQRRVLIAERPAGKHMAGRWEFPGGKVAAGETEAAALVRELREELGVSVTASRPFMRLSHEYEDRVVELSLWLVESFTGDPEGLDGQGLKWVTRSALRDEDILEADAPFVEALQKL